MCFLADLNEDISSRTVSASTLIRSRACRRRERACPRARIVVTSTVNSHRDLRVASGRPTNRSRAGTRGGRLPRAKNRPRVSLGFSSSLGFRLRRILGSVESQARFSRELLSYAAAATAAATMTGDVESGRAPATSMVEPLPGSLARTRGLEFSGNAPHYRTSPAEWQLRSLRTPLGRAELIDSRLDYPWASVSRHGAIIAHLSPARMEICIRIVRYNHSFTRSLSLACFVFFFLFFFF